MKSDANNPVAGEIDQPVTDEGFVEKKEAIGRGGGGDPDPGGGGEIIEFSQAIFGENLKNSQAPVAAKIFFLVLKDLIAAERPAMEAGHFLPRNGLFFQGSTLDWLAGINKRGSV